MKPDRIDVDKNQQSCASCIFLPSSFYFLPFCRKSLISMIIPDNSNPFWVIFLTLRVLRQKIADDVPVNIRQAAADAIVAKRQLFMVDAQQM
jgi:hypothetical protein